jgi:prepilin signal peptidase PulO-like enzyme (type II secretory pathway)
MNVVIALVAGVIGLIAGGVINALADDLPARENPRLPHYPDGTPRRLSAWLGVTAFLTGQRNSPKKHGKKSKVPLSLSWRHPIVEVSTALAFFGVALGIKHQPNLPFWCVYLAILILITVIDVEHRLILFVVIIPSCLFALLVALVSPEEGKSFSDYLIGGAAGFAVFFLMFLGGVVFTVLSRHQAVAFGFGDVMLATLSLILGWRGLIPAIFITVFAGAAGALVYILGRMVMRQRYRWFTPLPYGPYIVMGTIVVLLFREQVKTVIWAGF